MHYFSLFIVALHLHFVVLHAHIFVVFISLLLEFNINYLVYDKRLLDWTHKSALLFALFTFWCQFSYYTMFLCLSMPQQSAFFNYFYYYVFFLFNSTIMNLINKIKIPFFYFFDTMCTKYMHLIILLCKDDIIFCVIFSVLHFKCIQLQKKHCKTAFKWFCFCLEFAISIVQVCKDSSMKAL